MQRKESPHDIFVSKPPGRANLQALLGHESISTTQIYTNMGQERMEQVVARL